MPGRRPSTNLHYNGCVATTRTTAMLKQRCPRCLEGPIFVRGLTMHSHCPYCGLKLGREAGYFLGAMFISYAVGIPILGLLTFLLGYFVLPTWEWHWALFPAMLLFLPFVLPIVRYSRVIWLHLEWWVYRDDDVTR